MVEQGKRAGVLPLDSPVFSVEAYRRGEAALQGMSAQFREWLEADVTRLTEARNSASASEWAPDEVSALRHAAQDLEGIAATYEYPLITAICASLCRFLESPRAHMLVRQAHPLVNAHVDAVRASLRDGVHSTENEVGAALLDALEAQVSALGVGER